MTKIDAKGQPCPMPVVRAKKALEALGEAGGVVEILVDNDIARQNLQKMAEGLGHTSTFAQTADGIAVTIAAGEGCAVQADESREEGFTVAIGRDTMGEGSRELGQILIKSFIYALRALDNPPETILFFNSGAYLACRDSNVLEDLRFMEEKGTVIRICGTCADYYGLKDKIGVGEITNMYGIVEAMSRARRLINL